MAMSKDGGRAKVVLNSDEQYRRAQLHGLEAVTAHASLRVGV